MSVNPLYRGTGALEHADIAQAVRGGGADATWADHGDPALEAFLAASGVSSLSANYYRYSAAWKQLLGGTRDEAVWNRYAITRWFPGSIHAEVRLIADDNVEVRLAPSAPSLELRCHACTCMCWHIQRQRYLLEPDRQCILAWASLRHKRLVHVGPPVGIGPAIGAHGAAEHENRRRGPLRP